MTFLLWVTGHRNSLSISLVENRLEKIVILAMTHAA